MTRIRFNDPDLLNPPEIEMIDVDVSIRQGRANGIILINTSSEFGFMDVFVNIRDNLGNLIENGYAFADPNIWGQWGYPVTDLVSPGTSLVVSATAIDSLGGIGIRNCCRTTCDFPRQSLG